MNRLKEALDIFYDEDDESALIEYIKSNSSDDILDDAESLNIALSYEDVIGQSVHALAEYLIDSY